MNPRLAQLYRQVRNLHTSVLTAVVEVDQAIRTSADAGEQADAAYALRECAKFLDDARKRLEAQRRLAEKLACVVVTQLGEAGQIRTEHCVATPDVRTVVSIPTRSKNPELFAKLMVYLGVPEHCWGGGEHAAVQPHWPGLVELLATRQAEGKPLPDGIDPNKTWPEYKLLIRGNVAPDGEGPASAEATLKAQAQEAF